MVEHAAATATILPDVDKLMQLSSDNPVQGENVKRLRPPVETRLADFAKAVDFVKRNDTAGGIAMLREVGASETVRKIAESSGAMRAEEDRLFRLRIPYPTTGFNRAVTGSGLVVALAGISILLVRRSARARDAAETKLRDSNINLESTVDERTADLREANEEIQRFAYIVSRNLRSPLVNHLRSVPPRRDPGPARPGHRPRPYPRAGAAAGRHHVGCIGAQPGQHVYGHATD